MHLAHARLLYIIAEMFKEGQIDEMEKLELKRWVL